MILFKIYFFITLINGQVIYFVSETNFDCRTYYNVLKTCMINIPRIHWKIFSCASYNYVSDYLNNETIKIIIKTKKTSL